MATAMPEVPLPPQLADPPVPDAVLERLWEAIAELADEAALDVEAVARDMVERTSLSLDDPPGEARSRWQVDNDGGAEWAMRHVVEADDALRQLRWQADDWMARIEAWFAHRAKPLVARREFFAGHLERYALAVREQTNGKTKTVTLPSGKVTTTGSSAKATVADEAAVVAWADENLEPDQIAEVAPSSRRVLVSQLRQVVTVVEVPDRLRVTSACGCIVEVADDEPITVHTDDPRGPGDPMLTVGTVWTCTSCQAETLIGQVEVIDSHYVVRDEAGRDVPGTWVEPAITTAKVVPA